MDGARCAQYDAPMGVRVLGPVGVWVGGERLSIPQGKPLALLAMLALAGGEPVSVDRILVGLWGEDAAPGLAKTLQVHVSTLRSRLRGSGLAVMLDGAGYRLVANDVDEIDVVRFDRLVDGGLSAVAEARPAVASRLLSEALGLWSGAALANVLEAPFAAAAAARLESRRWAAVRGRAEAELAIGFGPSLVDALQSLVQAHPYDENACELLATALYRAGRSTAALDTIRELRRRLDEDLGLDFGPDLGALERQILQHSAELLVQPAWSAGNLPPEISTIIGRTSEIQELRDAVHASRLCTVTGSGGLGKTTLSIKTARLLVPEFADGVWLIELAPLSDAARVWAAVASALGIRGDVGSEAVPEFLSDRQVLLLLDNCEHVLDAAGEVVHELLRRCPRVRVLATSREPLAISGERLFRIAPLELPAPGDDFDAIRRRDSVLLFAERAALHRRGFVVDAVNAEHVARLCRQLDGMPLGIELAAARLRTMTLPALADLLVERLDVLSGRRRDVESRQQTMAELIGWSYDLLNEEEQRVFRRLSVFSGGWTVDAADMVCGCTGSGSFEVVTTLVDKSLVEYQDDTDRFRMLEPIRQYATTRLVESQFEHREARETHAAYFLHLAANASQVLDIGGGDQAACLDQLSIEIENLRHATATLLNDPTNSNRPLQMVSYLRWYWDSRGLYQEGADTVHQALERATPDGDAHFLTLALCTAADMHDSMGNYDRSQRYGRHAESLARRLADPNLIAIAATVLANSDTQSGQCERALERIELLDLSLVRSEVLDRVGLARSFALLQVDDFDGARLLLEEVIERTARSGNVRRQLIAVMNVSSIEIATNRLQAAAGRLRDALETAGRLRDHSSVAFLQLNLGLCDLVAGDPWSALPHYREALLSPSTTDPLVQFTAILGHAVCAAHDAAQHTIAAQLHGRLDLYCETLETTFDATEKRLRIDYRTRTRDALGHVAFDALAAAGRRLTRPEAVQLARTVRPGPSDENGAHPPPSFPPQGQTPGD